MAKYKIRGLRGEPVLTVWMGRPLRKVVAIKGGTIETLPAMWAKAGQTAAAFREAREVKPMGRVNVQEVKNGE